MEALLPKNKLYIDQEIKEEYPTAELAEDGISLNFRNHKNLKLCCYHCGTYNLSYGDKYFWHRCAPFQHFYCYYCFDHSLKRYTHTCVDGQPILDECRTIEHLLCGKLKFECKWDECRSIFSAATLRNHEFNCKNQPKISCPVKECKWIGQLNEMSQDHFKTHQDSKLILRNVVLKLESGKKHYLRILEKFVEVDYEIQELGEVYEHKFSLKCLEPIDSVKIAGLVSTGHILLKKMSYVDSVKSLRKNVILYVYFE